ncbi:acetyltransferase [Seonamhaeicola sp. ML3]|uniref:acetyltransferase n=1 Tax=Seonamhaeicola sp. ML3 TaxID=2937786 RepID=UPI00200F2939|nr:acetyltransferase [Seonamhaeicola sp. ML3]
MKTLAIVGAGHLGQQIAHYAITDGHYQKVVYFDDFTSKNKIGDFNVLGKISEVSEKFKNGDFDELIIGIGYKHLNVRKKIFKTYYKKIPFATIIHSSSWIDVSAVIEEGCIIYPKCEIDQKAIIKFNSVLNLGCSIAHDSIINEHCFLSPRVAVAGFVSIEEECVLGINCTIIDNLKIAKKTQIGAGAVVTKAISRSGVFYGNPAKFIR